MKESPIYRLPITVSGFIEIRDGGNTQRVVIDRYDWNWAAWPRVSPYGSDPDVAQVEIDGKRTFEADADIVEGIRAKVSFDHINFDTPWVISKSVEEDIIDAP